MMIFSLSSQTFCVETHSDIQRNNAIFLISRSIFAIILVSALFAMSGCGKAVISKIVTIPAQDKPNFIWAVDFSPDGNHVAVGSLFHIEVWDWKNNVRVADLSLPQGANPEPGTHSIKYNPDGSLLLVGILSNPRGHQIRVFHTTDWSIATEIVDAKPGVVTSFAFSPDGHELYAVSDLTGVPGNALTAYGVATWQPEWELNIGKIRPISMSISPEGTHLAIAGSLTVLPANVTDISEKIRLMRGLEELLLVDTKTRAATKPVETQASGPLSWSHDGSRLVMNGRAFFELFDARSGASISKIPEPSTGSTDIAFSSDGRRLIESDANGQGTGLGFKIWDAERQHLQKKVSGNTWCLAISRDSKLLATASDNATTIWKIAD
jgi:WD40 repeat protein